MDERRWKVDTDLGTVTVWAESEAQARSRGKWKAVHQRFDCVSRAEVLMAVRDCEVYEVARLKN